MIIPTFNRPAQLLETLREMRGCQPPPNEILVLIDYGDQATSAVLEGAYPDVKLILAKETLGPGGARNLLSREASHPILASFDDDSYPMDKDFFSRLAATMEAHPQAAVVAAQIVHDDEPTPRRVDRIYEVADFVGCGAGLRRDAVLATSGYIQKRLAYGIEEADLSLQLQDQGWRVLLDGELRVRHNTTREHQGAADVTAAHIENIALLAFLRYPVSLWPYGCMQVINRIFWSLRNKRRRGIIAGLVGAPVSIWRYRRARRPVRSDTVWRTQRLRRGGAGPLGKI